MGKALLSKGIWIFELQVSSVLGFPMIRDSLVSQNKGIKNSSLSRVKETTGQAQNLVMGQAGIEF